MLRPLVALLGLALPLTAVPAQAQAADDGGAAVSAPAGVSPELAEVLAQAPSGDPTVGLSTMERRDLRLELAEQAGLSGAQRARATAVLARPDGNRQRDFERVRVHWTAGETTSSYVNQVGAVSDEILATYEAAGYRAPKPDGARGGNGLLDIYLEDLGSQGLYGYCDTDQVPTGSGPWDAPAYCALDNDYAEFPGPTPTENLQVTAAHELFHAVQFAYDYWEDRWFMEATAAWVEDELFDDVDDNLQYLRSSPLTSPRQPLDQSEGLRVYGGWIFIRYLTEQLPARRGGLPSLVLDMWERADGARGGPDDYSVQAIDHALATSGVGLRAVWARFNAANRQPGEAYEEGRENAYPVAPRSGTVKLSGKRRGSGQVSRSLDHLSATTIRFVRAPRMAARTLRLRLDLPPTHRGSGAVATVRHTDGTTTTTALTATLGKNGDAGARVDFGRDVRHVEVTLANAGIDYARCYAAATDWSCSGRPQDDGLRFRVRANARR